MQMKDKGPVKRGAIKAAVTGYLSDSLVLLGQLPLPDDKAIHDIRVLMKKYRAAITLIRPQLDDATYQREYHAGKEAGRILCLWRETTVLRKTVKSLKKDNPKLFLKLWDNNTINELLRKPYTNWEEAAKQAGHVRDISGLLRKAFFRVRFLNLDDSDVHLLLKQLEQSHLAAAKAYIRCRNNPKPQLIHEFRKKSKTLLYQLCFFRQLNQRAVGSLEKRLDALTQNLGKYNDLAQIINILGYKYGRPENNPVTDELALVIRDRQDACLMKVWPAAYRIFSPGRSMKDILGLSF